MANRFFKKKVTNKAGFLVALLTMTSIASADPCGMVPPIYTGKDPPITRIGVQKTYVCYKDGVETFVIRPGFSGKVDEFGMLIPFPSVPAIRKVPDHIFPHVAKAIDPPEVVVDLREFDFNGNFGGGLGGFGDGGILDDATKEADLKFNEVRVVKQEAVGMYEVAVIQAGSSKALNKWMDDHEFRYPTGMDEVCGDYIKARWCFVAVKAKVGSKKAVTPKPGQRSVKPDIPKGASFDGNVQAMGFRFKTSKFVVPMRLSAFNPGSLRNIVYILADGPARIRSIPEEYVVRQISGSDLFRSTTEPLPLRIIGGTFSDISKARLKTLKKDRNADPHNGAAKELFATDLLAIRSGKLSLPYEETHKALLAIGESMDLRGIELDELHEEAMTTQRESTVNQSLSELKNMTLTVVDGDFPREVLAKQNLSLSRYRMPARRNKAESYDANNMGPGQKKQGLLKLGALDEHEIDQSQTAALNQPKLNSFHYLLSVLFVAIVIGFVYRKLRVTTSSK